MNKERTCPLCGLKMTWLSPHLWQCKCGHKERGEADAEEEGEGEHERRRRRGEEKDGRFEEPKQPPQKGLRET